MTVKYVGNVPSSSSARRMLLQSSSGTDVYYNIQNVSLPFSHPACPPPCARRAQRASSLLSAREHDS